jgi:hypothetical protein
LVPVTYIITGSGLQSGYATLDSIRAVQKSGHITGISANPITTLSGYSGGALAASWVWKNLSKPKEFMLMFQRLLNFNLLMRLNSKSPVRR